MALLASSEGKNRLVEVFYRFGRSLEYEDEQSIPVCNLSFALNLAETDECRTLCALRELITNGALDPYCASIFDALPFVLRTAPRYVYIDCGSTAYNEECAATYRHEEMWSPPSYLILYDSAGAYPAGVNRLRRLCV